MLYVHPQQPCLGLQAVKVLRGILRTLKAADPAALECADIAFADLQTLVAQHCRMTRKDFFRHCQALQRSAGLGSKTDAFFLYAGDLVTLRAAKEGQEGGAPEQEVRAQEQEGLAQEQGEGAADTCTDKGTGGIRSKKRASAGKEHRSGKRLKRK